MFSIRITFQYGPGRKEKAAQDELSGFYTPRKMDQSIFGENLMIVCIINF